MDIDSRQAEGEMIFKEKIGIYLNLLISFFSLQIFISYLPMACSVLGEGDH